MSITYRQHQDTRDGKIYRCVLMPDGRWWSAENLACEDSGLPHKVDSTVYGRSYSSVQGVTAVPAGSHLPIYAELTALRDACINKANALKSVGTTYWMSAYGTDLYGFDFRGAGSYNASQVWRSDFTGYAYLVGVGGAMARFAHNVSVFDIVPAGFDGYASVRFIVDVFNEPIPPTKIKGAFSGSGVKAYFTNHNTATLELPISAQTTTELTIDKDFISFWGPFLGNVRILVVDGEYISEWKDWNFNA